MVKRKRLETPSVDDLSRIEEEFRRETSPRRGGLAAPIAQVAADSADAMVEGAQTRDQEDAKAMRAAREQGLVIMQLPLARIQADAMIRDRTVLNAEEMSELQTSISLNGLRLPIEVFALPNPEPDGPQYGILSGFRRFKAMQHLSELTGEEKYSTIKAVLRDPDQMGGAFAAMIEENEIRVGLSYYERARAAAKAVEQGVFETEKAALQQLFSTASRSKRSKIGSFLTLYHALDAQLQFAPAIPERLGLGLVNAILDVPDTAEMFRSALTRGGASSAEEEIACLESILADAPEDQSLIKAEKPVSKLVPKPVPAGKPVRVETPLKGVEMRLADGKISLSGPGVTEDLQQRLRDWLAQQI